ncbi:MAG: YtxH domain-containing protein [Bacilli bacterium]|jgi:gas vesicle protein|nr:YtxH domain-containing protein [Bacilli bacterium]
MKLKNVCLLATGLVAGLLLAPQKGRDTYRELKAKVNDLYLQAKETNVDGLKEKVADIKVDVSKMNLAHSKEVVSKKASVIKVKLGDLITDLQKNEKIKPNVESAIDLTEKKINEVISYIDDNDLIEKTKVQTKKAADKTVEVAKNVKDKAEEFSSKIKGSLEEEE